MFKVSAMHIEEGLDTCTSRSSAVFSEVQAACRRQIMSVYLVTMLRYINSFRWCHRKKSNSVWSGDRDRHRNNSPPPHPVHHHLERYGNCAVRVSTEVSFRPCPGCDVIHCFPFFSRKLCSVQVSCLGTKEECNCGELGRHLWGTLCVFFMSTNDKLRI